MSQSNDLVELKKIWYKKLKESGFKDIEDTSRLTQDPYIWTYDSKYFHTNFHPIQFSATQSYFERARAFYFNYEFGDRTEKKIWFFHAEGMSHREIAKQLRNEENKINKDNVNKIILKLQALMKELEGI